MSEKLTPNLSSETIIQQTECWLRSFIIQYNICPFAEKVFLKQQIDICVIDEVDWENCLLALIDQIMVLEATDEIETALLVYPVAVDNFDKYLEFLAIANQLIEDQEHTGKYLLASFHPDYCFEGEDENDASNYTNRSPWPMIHIIRHSSIEKGLQYYKNPEQIPENNIKLTREIGTEFLRKLRARCMRPE